MADSRSSLMPRVGRALIAVAVASALAAAPVASSTPAVAVLPVSGQVVTTAGSDGVVTTAAAFTLTLTPFKSGFANPVFMTSAHDGTGRLFVVEKGGRIKVIRRDGTVLPTPLIDLSARVSKGSEQGLLGLAFHPNFRTNGKFYVDFTNLAGATVINEYRLSPPGSNRVTLPGRRVLTIAQPYANHNGGDIAFGPDGFLYIGMGDGGSAGDPGNRAQSLNTLLGKILRINVNGHTRTRGYLIPSSNPYVGRVGRDEIWSYGLRNPWRFSFDRTTGDLVIGDVGQNAVEEIDFSPGASSRGANYGWRPWEGRRRNFDEPAPGTVFPVITHSHGEGYCSITGGYVVRDPRLTGWVGRYLYGDFCRGRIESARLSSGKATEQRSTGLEVPSLSSFGEDALGRVYAVSLDGAVYRIVAR